MRHTLAEQRFGPHEDVKKNGSMNGSQQKGKIFTGVIITNYPKDGENVQQTMEHTMNKTLFVILQNLTCFFEENKSTFHACTLNMRLSKTALYLCSFL